MEQGEAVPPPLLGPTHRLSEGGDLLEEALADDELGAAPGELALSLAIGQNGAVRRQLDGAAGGEVSSRADASASPSMVSRRRTPKISPCPVIRLVSKLRPGTGKM